MKAILIVEMPKKCIDCPLVYKEDHFIYRCKVSEDQVDSNGIYCDCPLRPSSDYIPIEWLNKRAEEIAFAYWTNARNKVALPLNELPLLIDQIIGEWEKENETHQN